MLIENGYIVHIGKERPLKDQRLLLIDKKYEKYISDINEGDEVIFNIDINQKISIKEMVEGGPLVITDDLMQEALKEEKLAYSSSIINRKTPRTMVAIDNNNMVLFIVVDGYMESNPGINYDEAQLLLEKIGNIKQAMMLDGGSSSIFYYNGKILNYRSENWRNKIPAFLGYLRKNRYSTVGVYYMANIKPDKKRIVGLFGHHGCGKTTLMDAILKNYSGADRIGQRYLDSEEVEKDKGSTFSNHVVSVDYNDTRFYFFDTPGMSDFLGDIDVAINAVDNVVLVVNASSGIEVTTERIWKIARANKKPIFIFINQMDKEGVNFGELVSSIKETFEDGVKVVPLQVPIGEGPEFQGIVNLITHEAFEYEMNQSGKDKKLNTIPEMSKTYYEDYHQELIEDVVETNEAMMEKYLEEGEEALNPENVFKALHQAFEDDEIVPIVVGSAEKNIGLDRFMEMIRLVGMYPSERVFKGKIEDKEFEILGKEEEPFVGLVVKNAVDPFVGKLTYIRVLSGTVKSGDSFVEVQEDSNEKVSHIYIPRFDKNEEVSEAGVGDIIVVPKLKKSRINDTVAHSSRLIRVDVPEFPEPMISKSVKPTSKNEIDKVNNALSKLQESDPTFSWNLIQKREKQSYQV